MADTDTTMTAEWQAKGGRALLELLAERGEPLHYSDIASILRERLQPSGSAVETVSNGSERWWNLVAWGATDQRAAGWLEKSRGFWSITEAGRQAMRDYVDPFEMRRTAQRAYREQLNARPSRRAWLLRGSSVLGANLVPEWLAGDWCSLAASQLPAIETDVSREELAALAESTYDHLKHQERTAKVNEILDFVIRMKPGDLVLTTSDDGIYVGDLGDEWSYTASEGGRSNLRRPVSWRNPDGPVDFGELPGTLQASLKTGATLLDLTAELTTVDNLVSFVSVDPERRAVEAPELARFQRFEKLPSAVADELLVTTRWLDDFVELLNEARQVVLFGPPGTGKTYLARRIAEHLVGAERTRLVQFHPSYTYEDFFEGYRPSGDSSTGSVSLELRAGPLRRLATEAREHPEQGFVLIIDELNRANIAKVFGELYFLLEYRDDAVEVMYGGEPFTLPKNLYLIATMNTADRSIALLDAAMRRRFAFLELHPADAPTSSMLAMWLSKRELPATAARFLQLINEQIDDYDAHIGPSYFMRDDQSEARIKRIFDTQILPLLRETYYDRWSSVGTRFDFRRLWDAAGGSDNAEPESTSDADRGAPATETEVSVAEAAVDAGGDSA